MKERKITVVLGMFDLSKTNLVFTSFEDFEPCDCNNLSMNNNQKKIM